MFSGGSRNLQPGIHVYSFCQNHCCFSKIVTLLPKSTLFCKNHGYSHEDPRIPLAPPLASSGSGRANPACMHACMHVSSVLGHKGLASGIQPCKTTHSTVIRSSSEPDASVAAQQFLMKPNMCVSPMHAPPVVPPPDTPSSAVALSVLVVVTAGEGVATTPSSPPPAAVLARPPSSRMTPTRRSGRHAVADDGRMDTDEDSLAKAMRRKAAQNLDNQGTSSSPKSFLSFSTTSIVAKLNNVGVSLGNNENDISVSTNALRHLEYDRLKVTPRVSSKSFTSHLDEEELHATSDGQLLAHVVGEVSDVGLEEPGLSSLIELTASGRKSKSDRSKKAVNPLRG